MWPLGTVRPRDTTGGGHRSCCLPRNGERSRGGEAPPAPSWPQEGRPWSARGKQQQAHGHRRAELSRLQLEAQGTPENLVEPSSLRRHWGLLGLVTAATKSGRAGSQPDPQGVPAPAPAHGLVSTCKKEVANQRAEPCALSSGCGWPTVQHTQRPLWAGEWTWGAFRKGQGSAAGLRSKGSAILQGQLQPPARGSPPTGEA